MRVIEGGGQAGDVSAAKHKAEAARGLSTTLPFQFQTSKENKEVIIKKARGLSPSTAV